MRKVDVLVPGVWRKERYGKIDSYTVDARPVPDIPRIDASRPDNYPLF